MPGNILGKPVDRPHGAPISTCLSYRLRFRTGLALIGMRWLALTHTQRLRAQRHLKAAGWIDRVSTHFTESGMPTVGVRSGG